VSWLGRHADVEAHFAGKTSSAADRSMFAHVRTCERCRDEYRGFALLESLEADGAERAQARLARGVFDPAVAPQAKTKTKVFGFVLAFGCFALVVSFGRAPASFQARGGAGTSSDEPSLAIYRVPRDRETPEVLAPSETVRAGNLVHAGESLAVSYTNPASVQSSGSCCLMVFGRDASGRVYWFWPAWNDASQDPTSVPISTGAAALELTEAVRHPLQTGPLTIVGLFTPRPLHVHEVEAALAKGLDGLQAFEGHIWTDTLEVSP
jgi:hypothetical protein